jgi:hypothetical protein
MFLRINERVSIDNLNDSPMGIVDQLQELLASGVEARPDPKRRDFYEVEKSGQVFFIHTRPLSGRVMLLATWRTGLPMAEVASTV